MTEIKDKYNWNELAEKGNSYEEIRIALDGFKSYCSELAKGEIYGKDNEFKDEFKQDLESKIAQIFENSSLTLTKTEVSSMRKSFLKNLKDNLDLIVLRKAFAQISFSQYPLFRFFEALSSFVDEAEFEVLKDELKITISDPSRVGLMGIAFNSDSFKFFRLGKVGINLDDLKDLLKCNAKDNSTVSLVFTEEELVMGITSTKRKRTITRTLTHIDFELQEIPMDTLNNIVYTFEFEMTKDDFVDLIANSDRYSEIVKIEANSRIIVFSESSSKGNSEIDFKKGNLVSLRFQKEKLLLELEREQSQESKEAIKQTLKEKSSAGSYSLSFLGIVKSFSNILDPQDKISFSLKTDTPFKTEISFKKLSSTKLTYYLAPRIPEEDYEEEDFDESEEESEQDQF
jgi:hypothetical protein